MLFKIGQKEFERNIVLNSLIIVLLIIIFCILTISTSSLLNSTNKYRALYSLIDNTGYFLGTDLLINQETRELIRDKKQLEEILGDNIDVAGQYILPGAFLNGQDANIWSYDWEIIDNYTPSIVKGRWFNKKDIIDTEKIYGVILDTGEYLVGDKVIITNWNNNCPVEIEIIGLLEDSSSVFGYMPFLGNKSNYLDGYYTYNLEFEQVPLLLLSNDQLGKYSYFNPGIEGLEGEGIQRQQKGAIFITWNNNIADYQNTTVEDFIFNSDNFICFSETLESMKIESDRSIIRQITNILPIIICVFVLVIIATISVSAISVKRQLHNYAIYYICGLKWKDCIYISLIHSFICSSTALIIAYIGILVSKYIGVFSEISLKLGIIQLIICIFVQIIFVGFSLIMPINIIKKTSAKALLNTNK